jgi:predicted TIM-barrel fold metal-dependent hydrolase
MTELAQHIQATPLADTHEHIFKEADYVENGPDVLQDLFHTYIAMDLATAGAPAAAIERLINAHDPDVEGRWNGVKEAWEHCQFTSYGQATRLAARLIYGMDEITLSGILAAAEHNTQLRKPGERLRLLRDVANLDHVQIDDQSWACLPDASGPDFFLYDLSWSGFCEGQIAVKELYDATHVEVRDLASLRQAMAGLFAKYGDCAIAVKTAHAYERTLAWREREDVEVEPILQKALRGETLGDAERLCLGDWCWARGVELAIEYRLPFKIHTGIMAFNNIMAHPDRLRPAHLGPLLTRYGSARFVLMHLSYPYMDELITVAKHFPCVYVDMCWGWAINLHSAVDFVRRIMHGVPVNKLFAFGGDTLWPSQTVALAVQARAGLTRALQAEVEDGFLTEAEAIQIATRVMRDNQAACFDLAGRRATIRSRMMSSVPAAELG